MTNDMMALQSLLEKGPDRFTQLPRYNRENVCPTRWCSVMATGDQSWAARVGTLELGILNLWKGG